MYLFLFIYFLTHATRYLLKITYFRAFFRAPTNIDFLERPPRLRYKGGWVHPCTCTPSFFSVSLFYFYLKNKIELLFYYVLFLSE